MRWKSIEIDQLLGLVMRRHGLQNNAEAIDTALRRPSDRLLNIDEV